MRILAGGVFVCTLLAAAGWTASGNAQENLAKHATVHASSELNGNLSANAVDGDLATEWAGTESFPGITLEWKEPVKIGRIVIRDRHDPANRLQGGKARFSDGSTLDIDDIPPGGKPCEIQFEPRMATSLRVDFFSAIGKNPGLAEIEVYSDGKPKAVLQVAAPKPGSLVTIAANDPRISTVDRVCEGKWGGAMWCPFDGTSVKLIGSTGPACGIANIYIDGLRQKTADWYSEKPASDVTIFAADHLPDGKHLLGVLALETKRPESQGTALNWSRIEYVAGEHPDRFVVVPRTQFDPNVPQWLDDRGEMMQNHLGGIMVHDGKYYMIGQDWRGKRIPDFQFDWAKNTGMPIYSSPDLMNWTYCGKFGEPSSNPEHPLYNYAIAAGRGKLLRARGTGKFVALFMMVDNTFKVFNTIAAAVADKPEGPYQWHGILEFEGRRMQGADTAVFTDDDGKQYLITGKHHPTEWNVADCLYELTPDCLGIAKAKVLGTSGEAPAMFKHEGVYYLLHSQLTGLNTNDNFYHTATNIWGPWEAKGKIAQGEHSHQTFLTQTMDVVPVAGKKGAFIWIGDSLRGNAEPNTRTVWLPLTIVKPGQIEIRWRDAWDLSAFKD
jgi:hypothetical protein